MTESLAAERLMAETLMAERVMAERVLGKGTVKWLSLDEGCGLISPDEGDEDLLFRSTSIAAGGFFATLTEGARVQFEVHGGRRGLEAFDVVSLEATR